MLLTGGREKAMSTKLKSINVGESLKGSRSE